MVYLYFGYILLSVLLFYFGPIEYPMVNAEITFIYIILCYSFLFSGFIFGYKFIATASRVKLGISSLRIIFLFSAIISIYFALFIIIKLSDGDILSSISTGVLDSGSAYYLNLHREKVGGIVTQLMTLFSPLIILSLSLGVILFKNMNYFEKFILASLVVLNLISYAVKGTNFGMFLTLMPIIVVSALHFSSKRNFHFSRVSILGIVLFVVFILYFLSAMSTRLNMDYIPESLFGISVNKDSILFILFPPGLSMAITAAMSYISQGYYGLSLAFDYPFDSTYGFGSGHFIMNKLGGFVSPDLWASTYQFKMDNIWDSSVQWHTAFVWLANDFSFFGVFPLLFIFGCFSAIVYKNAKIEGSTVSKALFSLVTIILIFLPANNILFGNPFVFTSFFSLFILWILTRRVYLK